MPPIPPGEYSIYIYKYNIIYETIIIRGWQLLLLLLMDNIYIYILQGNGTGTILRDDYLHGIFIDCNFSLRQEAVDGIGPHTVCMSSKFHIHLQHQRSCTR